MAQENVGTIYYDVVGDTSKLVNSSTAANESLDAMQKKMAGADKAQNSLQGNLTKTAAAVQELGRQSDRTGGMLSSLQGLFAGLVTGATVLNLVNMAEAYNETSERIKMATSSAAEYEMVQQRLIKTANNIYRPLKEAQETYILTADSLRSMGYTTSQALDITDSLSLSFVKNATATDRASSAISAFTKSMQKGKVEGDAWESLIAAVPTVVNDIAAATKKTSAEIRQMGVEGKISASMLSEGLRQSLAQNEAAAAGMATTVKDAFNNITNNLSVFLGEANSATGTTAVLSAALLAFGNNIATVANALGVLGAGALARYVAQIGAGVAASVQASIAARSQAVEELKRAQALAASTAAAAANATAMRGLTGTSAAAAAATQAHTAALAGLATAQRAASAAGVGMIALLGGPAGIVALLASAGAAMYLFSDNTRASKITLNEFAQSAELAAEKLRNMSESQKELARAAATKQMADGYKEVSEAARDLAEGPLFSGGLGVDWTVNATKGINEAVAAFKAGEISATALDARLVDLVNTYASANGKSQEWTQAQYANIAAVTAAATSTDNAKNSLKNMDAALWDLQHAANMAALGIDNVTNAMGGISAAEGKAIADVSKAIATFGKSGAAGKLYDIDQARKGLGDLKEFSKETLDQLERDYKRLDGLQSRKRGGSGGKAAGNAQARALAEVEKEIEAFGKTSTEQKLYQVGQGLRGIGTMAKFSKAALTELQSQYEKLSKLEEDKKRADLAKTYLSQLQETADKVGKMTTAERLQYDLAAGKVFLQGEQLAKATQLAGVIDERNKKEKELADTMSIQSANLSAQRKLQAELLKYAMEIDSATMGSDARAQMQERAQIEQEFAQRVEDIQNRRRDAIAKADKKDIDRVNKLYDDQLKIEKSYQEKSIAAYESHIAKKRELDADWRVGALRALNDYQESAGKTAQQSETAFGNFLRNTEDALVEFVKTGKFNFRSLADSIIADIARIAARTLVSGVANWLGQAVGAYFGVPAAGGAGGSGAAPAGRASGGPVKSGSMYQVNERGTPELLNIGANQYLMMGNKSGRVDNMSRAAGAGSAAGGVHVAVNVINNTDSQVRTNERQSGDGRIIDIVIEAVAADVAQGGRVAGSLQSTYGLNRGVGVPRFAR